jgi:hypothetical protein
MNIEEDRFLQFEFELNGKLVTPGERIKVRGERKSFMFCCIVISLKEDTSWIECIGEKGQVKYFHPGEVSMVKKKRSFWKNV